MKAIALLATLKPTGVSNTQVLTEFLGAYLKKEQIELEIVRLAEHNIASGTYLDMGESDDWPAIFDKVKQADIVLFATPVWWNSHSSELQRVIERMDEVYNEIEQGKTSQLEGKLGGVIITGDRDGAEHITGNLANFMCCMGITLVASGTLGVLWEGHAKDSKKTKAELLDYYKTEYSRDAEAFAQSLGKLGRALFQTN